MKRRLPIGVALRRERQKKVKSNTNLLENIPTSSPGLTDLENQIAKLEQELNESLSESSSDEISDEDSDRDEENEEKKVKENNIKIIEENDLIEIIDENGNIVAMKSKLEEEKINPLPHSLLPDPNCGATRSKHDKKVKKIQAPPPKQQSGLEKSIREMLKNYKPTSSERRPYWCRICCYQGQNEQDFFQHRESELHKLASQQERKMSTCKLCRKEFTSPEQLKEHLKGKAHIERLEYMKSKQNGRRFES